MEEIKEKKEWSKLKIIGSLFVLILIGLFIFSGVGYSDYKNNQQEKSLEEVKQQIEVQTNQPIILKNVKIPDPNIKNPLTTVNPRSSFQNSSGHEICALDHQGGFTCIGNLTFINDYNLGSGYGFFDYLGDQITPIFKGWFLSLNTTNITSTRWCNSTACFSTEQFTIDTNTDTFNTTQQMRDALNNSVGTFNLTANISNNWNNLSQYNATTFDSNGGKLNIIETWWTNFIQAIVTGYNYATQSQVASWITGNNSQMSSNIIGNASALDSKIISNVTVINGNIMGNGTLQWHDQEVNTTSKVKFDTINTTILYHSMNEKNCWGNASHPCWIWTLGNATGFYAWGGG